MQIDYIKGKDLNEILSYKKFFNGTTKLDILEDEKIISYLINNAAYSPSDATFFLIKLDDNMKKYLKYSGNTISNYYSVLLENYENTIEWIYDEKNGVLISSTKKLLSNEDIDTYMEAILKQIEREYTEVCKPIEIRQEYEPLYDFKNEYLTLKDKYRILISAKIPAVIDYQDDLIALTNFLNQCGIKENDTLLDLIYINKENLFNMIKELPISTKYTNFETLNSDLKLSLYNFCKDEGQIILCGDTSSTDKKMLDYFGIIKLKHNRKSMIEFAMNEMIESAYKLSEYISDVESPFIIGKNEENTLHPGLIAFYITYHNLFENISMSHLQNASKLLYLTKNPRTLSTIFGDELCNKFLQFSVQTISTEQDINKILKYIEKSYDVNYRSKYIIKLSRCNLEDELIIREKLEKIVNREELMLFDILRSIETKKDFAIQDEKIKIYRKNMKKN